MNIALYLVTAFLLGLSWFKDRGKTGKALKKAWRAFENILPEFLVVILVVGILLALADPEMISAIIGSGSGWMGVVLSAIVGAITLIPGFVAFPMASLLLQGGSWSHADWCLCFQLDDGGSGDYAGRNEIFWEKAHLLSQWNRFFIFFYSSLRNRIGGAVG